jgi:hypothetical protein
LFVTVAFGVAAIIAATAWMGCERDNRQLPQRCTPVSARRQHPVVAPVHVSGHVTNKAGDALAGAIVALKHTGLTSNYGIAEAPTLFATTDANGAWALDKVPPGEYVASAATREYLPANHANFAIAAGAPHAGVDMSLEPGGVLVGGMVSDFDGKPVVGARVEVTNGRTELQAPYVALTGADGKYGLSLPDRQHWFAVHHDDFTPTSQRSVDVAGTPQSLDFKLVRGGTIRGIVIARATGKPVPRAVVQASSVARGFYSNATADDDGKFVLRGAPPGVVSLAASGVGFASAQPTRVGIAMAEQIDGVRVSLEPALSICGRVVEKGTHNGIAGATIYAGSSSSSRPQAIGPSASDGTFQIVGVRRGPHYLSAHAESKVAPASSKQVDVSDTDITGVIVEMESGVTLTGRIDPPASASISIVNPDPGGAGKLMESVYLGMTGDDSDASGVWKLEHVPPGKFEIVAETREGAVGKLPIVVADRDQKDLAITLEKRASVSGRVIDTKGAAVVGLKIVAMPDARTRAHSSVRYAMEPAATSDSNGAFKIVGLEAGAYNFVSGEFADRLLATEEQQIPPLPTEVAAGAALTNLVVTVEPHDGVIRGVVTLDGKPTRDVWVTALLQRPDGSLFPGDIGNSESVLTDANGNFLIDHLLERPYTVVAEGSRGASRGEKAGVKSGDTTSIELQPVGTLTGHVKMGGKPVTSYDLRCRRGTADPIDLHVEAADGAFALDYLSQGHYRCGAATKTGNAAGEIDIGSAPATMDLTLVPWATITGLAISVLDGAPVPQLPAQSYSYSGADDQVSAFAFYEGAKRPKTDANGRFTIDHVANGPGHVSLWDQRVRRPVGNRAYTVTPGARIDIGTVLVIPPRVGDRGTLGMDVKPSGAAFEVTAVSADGPAAQAGIVVGDKITAIQGHTIAEITSDMVRRLLAPGAIGAGQTLKLKLARGTTVSVTVAKL